MSIEAKEIKLGQLLEEVKGFYIPDYQRPYTWDEENLKRLFETITSSIQSFFEYEGKEEYYAFLGAILSVSGSNELQKAYNISQEDSPSTVHALIDGQQRITSLVLLISELYLRLYNLKGKVDTLDSSIKNEIKDSLISALGDAKTSLFIKNSGFESGNEDEKHEFLPKIINAAKEDEWKKYQKGKYNSPIAKYLLNLSFFTGSDKPPIEPELKTVLNVFRELLDDYISENREKENFFSEKKFLNNKMLQERLLYRQFSDALREKFLTKKNREFFDEFITVTTILKFMRQYIMFAKIEVGKENFAFDIFDSLNSTGDPLTAFETFRPVVIKHLGNKFRGSQEEAYLKNFTDYNIKEKGEQRHKSTKEFIISFALYEDGTLVDKSLNRQRKYLQDRYKQYSDADKKVLCEGISLLTDFYNDIWDEDVLNLSGAYNTECKLGLSILKETNHTITIPVLARYYTELRLASQGSTGNYKKFNGIVKSIIAFSLFWRILHNGSTAGIEDVYRELLASDISRTSGNDILSFDLNNYLKKRLNDKKLGNSNRKRSFINIVSGSQYSKTGNNTWLKFFMLAALHDTVPDGKTGLDKKGVSGSMPTLDFLKWKAIEPLTIEHIAPQKPIENSSWDPLLSIPQNSDSIGNLTLLLRNSNSFIGNREWEDKKSFYNVLCSTNPEERLESIEQLGFPVKGKTKNYLLSTNYWPSVKSLAVCNRDWTPDLVQERAKRLAELAWDNLSPWLGY